MTALALLAGGVLSITVAVSLALSNPGQGDILADWLVTRAAWDRGEPFRPLARIAQDYGVEYAPNASPGSNDVVTHPRTPGALVLQFPLTLVPHRFLPLGWAVLSGLLLTALVIGAGWFAGLPVWMSALYVIPAAVAPSVVTGFHWGTQSIPIALLLLGVAVFLRGGRDGWAAGVLAIAITLKVYPLLLVPILATRPRALVWTAFLVLGLNLGGILLLGLDPRGAVHVLAGAPDHWFGLTHNASFAGILHQVAAVDRGVGITVGALLGGLAVIGLALAAVRGVLRSEEAFLAGIPAVLLAVPNSWIHYDAALIPILLFMVARLPSARAAVSLMGGSVLLGFTVFLPGITVGMASAIARVGALLGMGIVFRTARSHPGGRGAAPGPV